ncbi:MAG: cyclophilin-like fold protein [Planctomycetota bacterium]|nr:cyclophilin-like fold protein [Planctomycetota bacterium]
MSLRITIKSGQVRSEAELNDTPCARAIYDALPIEAAANTWGEEVYFSIPVDCELADDAREAMAVGELGYWPVGKAFCIFFGRTPASGEDSAPRAASNVNPIGHIVGDVATFKTVTDGQKIVLSAEA